MWYFRDGLIWRISNRAKARIWGDKWLLTPTTYMVQSPLKILATEAKVQELIDHHVHGWNLPLIEAIFSPINSRAIKTIPISFTNQPDVQVWRGTRNGILSVSSAYHFLKERDGIQQPECSLRPGDNALWRGIWNLHVSNTSKNFMWRACQNLLPTKDNLIRRKVVNDLLYPICSLEAETTYNYGDAHQL